MLDGGGPELPPEIRAKTFRTLASTLKRIQGVADDVQALAIAQGSEESAQGRRLALRAVIEEVVGELANVADEKGVRLEMREVIPEVQVDATRVELALLNLVGNAIKYSDPDKPDRWVLIAVKRHDETHWQIEVADNGVGIPREMHRLVFHEFVRAHPEVADGTGLGLAIAREAVLQMDGKIWLESTPGVGTSLYLTVLDPPAARQG
jgi:signal transduction histidine kinase